MSKAFWASLLLILPTLLFADVPLEIEWSQQAQGGWTGNSVTGNPLTEDGYAAYALTAFSASVPLEYGMITFTPYLGNEISCGFASGEAGGYSIVGTPILITGLGFEVAVSEVAVPYLNLELSAGAPVDTGSGETALIELVFTPTVGVAGEFEGFFYDFSEAFEFSLDSTTGNEDNDEDNLALDIVGTYVLGYGTGIYSVELSDELSFGLGVLSADEDLVIANDARFTIAVDLGSVLPSVGALYVLETVDGDTVYSIIGGSLNIGFVKENLSANFGYEAGRDLENDVFVSLISMSVGLIF